MSEHELIQGLKSADEKTYSILYDRYANNLYGVINKLVNSESESENLLQDCFVKIWRNIESYDPSKGRLYTWMITIARNLALDYKRSQYFISKKMIQNEDSLVNISAETKSITKLDYLGLEKILINLDHNLKQMIDLQYYYGYSQQEIAEEFKIPLGTVKSRTRIALQKLRDQLDEQ
ncbi:MAG: sigma-70 family RNA polymerase sigma factor [Saprospiraceae bacterium]|nr:sigma-70 family RNA polymerase sigma factor [Saprospiraceae bacterium]